MIYKKITGLSQQLESYKNKLELYEKIKQNNLVFYLRKYNKMPNHHQKKLFK